MAKKSPEQNVKNTDEKSLQEFADKDFMSFALRMMVAFEVEKYLENSFSEHNLTAQFDDFLLRMNDELLRHAEEFGTREQD